MSPLYDDAYRSTKAQPQPAPPPFRLEVEVPEPLIISPKPEDRLAALTNPSSLGGESFRLLASRLNYARKTLHIHKLLITSSITGEGKSVISANLAIALASQGGLRTLVIDADHRHAALTRMFNCQGRPGMREWLTEGASFARFSHRIASLPLWCVPTGRHGPNQERSLQADRLMSLLAETDDHFDWVIVDSPPITVMADATIWLAATDASLLVARQGVTPKKMLRKALIALDSSKLLGIVLNGSDDASHSYYHFYQGKKTA